MTSGIIGYDVDDVLFDSVEGVPEPSIRWMGEGFDEIAPHLEVDMVDAYSAWRCKLQDQCLNGDGPIDNGLEEGADWYILDVDRSSWFKDNDFRWRVVDGDGGSVGAVVAGAVSNDEGCIVGACFGIDVAGILLV